jgi:hypothetical protein
LQSLLKNQGKNMQLTFKKIIGLSLFAMTAVTASAAEPIVKPTSSVLLLISPHDYNYSAHIGTPYYSYWFEQGPIVEPIAFKALQAKASELAMCTGNETASSIVRIKPYLFFNLQLGVYHSKLEATVYSGGGSELGRYVGEAQQLGSINSDASVKYSLNKVYALAMQDLMTKLEIKALPANAKAEAMLPCRLIAGQAEARFSFY